MEKVSNKTNESIKIKSSIKALYAVGSISDNILGNIIFALAMPIYNIALGVDPMLVGLALSLPRIWDAVSDPIMGNVSDNTRGRFGRRRPYIFIGAILAGLFTALIWMPPAGLSSTGNFIYLLIMSLGFYTAFTMYSVPFHAFGLEMTSDYNERTNVQAYKSFFAALCGIALMSWPYRLCFYKGFGDNEVEGVRVVGIIYGCMVAVCGMIPAIFCRENVVTQSQSKMTILKAMKYTCTNRVFLRLLGIVLMVAIGVFTVLPMLSHMYIYHICGGDKAQGAKMMSCYLMTVSILGIIFVPVIAWCSARFGKRRTVIGGLSLVMISYLSSWFLFNPSMPYLSLIVAALFSPGINIAWILLGSMCADVCDTDELKTGLRREAMYTSVYGWVFKLGIASVMMVSGFIVKLSGFDSSFDVQTPETILRLRIMYAFIPPVFLSLAILFTWKFPLTKQKVEEIQQLLTERREQKQLELEA